MPNEMNFLHKLINLIKFYLFNKKELNYNVKIN
jgi:hypothetical protein